MIGQNQLAQAINTLKDVANHSATTDKQRILKAGDNPYLREILYYAYNKYLTYRVKQIIDPDKYATVQPDTMYEFKQLCDNLAEHKWGTNEALDKIKKFLALNTVEGAEVFKNALLRDIRAGIDVKSINRAFPGLVPTFDVMLADKVGDVTTLPYPCVGEVKLDGQRVVAIYDGADTVRFYSREGALLDEKGVMAAEIKKLAPGMPFVLDGEFIAYAFNTSNKTCAKYKDGNWKFTYALSMVKNESTTAQEVTEHLRYYIWDIVDYEYFITAGVKGKAETLEQRKVKLTALFNRMDQKFNNIEMLPNTVLHNHGELSAYFKRLRAQGEEGLMVKNLDAVYEFKRSKNLLKLKEFFDADLMIVGAEEGSGKYEGLLGALHVSSACGKIKCKVGSGFNDEERAELWVEHLAGRLNGNVATITYQEITKDGSLRFPTFNHIRFDKTEADRF